MTIAQLLERMFVFSDGNTHDIDHLIRVWTYAKTIGALEMLDAETQFVLEAAAITHDIACPLCREKYGNPNGKLQEREGAPMVRAFLADSDLRAEQIDRIAFLVGHHHSYQNIDGLDHQILLEADYIANASENMYSREQVELFLRKYVKTDSGRRITRAVLCAGSHERIAEEV